MRVASSVTALVGLVGVAGCFSDPPRIEDEDVVSLSGIVQSSVLTGSTPLVGVRVEVVGAPAAFAITDADGAFVIDNAPAGKVAYLAASPSNDYVGTIQGVDVRFADIDGIEIGQLSTLQIEQQLIRLREEDPAIRFDSTRGHIVMVSDTLDSTATLAPLPDDATVYSLEGDGTPILHDSTFRFFLLPLVVFLNLGTHDPGALQLSIAHPTQPCRVDFASPPTLPNHLTWVSAQCGF